MYLIRSMNFISKAAIKCGLVLLLSATAVSMISCGSDSSGKKQSNSAPNYIVWKGESSYPPANPEVYWGYYNITAGKAYLYDGASWVVIAKVCIKTTAAFFARHMRFGQIAATKIIQADLHTSISG
jgi:hypothetical protein